MTKATIVICALLTSTVCATAQNRLPCGYGPDGPIPCGYLPYPGPHIEGFPPRYRGPTPYPNYMGRGAPIMPGVIPRYQERPWPYAQDYWGSGRWRY
jgi:hypothetical protein